MKTLTITGAWRFSAGEPVPGWLLDQEPTGPEARRADFTFLVDCDVIETDGRYVIVPTVKVPDGVLRLSRSGGLKVSAPGRSVWMVTDWSHIPGVDEG